MKTGAINRDGALILAAASVRSTTVGLVGVVLAIYLSDRGLSPAAIGGAIGAGLAGGAAATLLAGLRGDAFGRRNTLILLALLTAVGYLGAATGRIAVVMPLAVVGMLNGMGRDRGAASALEQAILPETAPATQRTWLLAWYNLVLDIGHAVGALAGATPTLLVHTLHWGAIAAHRATFIACAVGVLMTVIPYALLSDGVEIARQPLARGRKPYGPEARRSVRKLAALFGIDSIGGGFLNSALIAYWFFRRYGASEAELAMLFFAARVLNACSHIVAAWLARRIGLVNTMVFTHLPSSLLLMTAPIAPTITIASILFLAREALVEMDVPTRQSYVMAIVEPDERSFASGVTNVTRNVGWAIGPSIAGAVMEHVLAAPLVIGSTLKIAYDVLLYISFRHIRAPEEKGTGIFS